VSLGICPPQIVSSARLSPLQQDTFVRLRAAHLANIRTLAARRKQRVAERQVRRSYLLQRTDCVCPPHL
jgi:hypothetical protein